MILPNAKVPPLNCTLMGLVRGVADYYGTGLSDPLLYGVSGHAFMINIHETLCPSGPYCWKREHCYALLPNAGIEMKDVGFYSDKNTAADRAAVDDRLKKHLLGSDPCGLVNMEFQLISGFDETGFITSQPWAPHHDFPPRHLTFGSWSEMGNEIHVNFFTFRKVKPAAEREMVRAGLAYALDVYANPANHTSKPYATGAAAYDAWISAVEKGHGQEHGNWWNATVWAECRSMASRFFTEITPRFPKAAPDLALLTQDYQFIGDTLGKVADKSMAPEPKIALLKDAREREASAIGRLDRVVKTI